MVIFRTPFIDQAEFSRCLVLLFRILLVCTNLHCSKTTQEHRSSGVAYANATKGVKYIGSIRCMSCHPDIFASYMQSEMGRSMSEPGSSNIIEEFPQRQEVYDSVGDFYYEMTRQGRQFFQREFRRDMNNRIVHERTVRVDYIMGSGNNLRMYFHDEGGMLYELPLTWHVHKKRWDFSPGYREFGNLRFSRYAKARCIACHNSYLEQSLTANERYVKPYPLGIGCERCHGPGELHVRQAMGEKLAGLESTVRTIVNPRKLPFQEQLDVCRQCHLQGEAWALHGNSNWFDFRPGTKLETNRSVYFRATSKKEVFEVADSPHRFSLSRCFQKSNGALTCIVCHNPHRSIKTFPIDHYNQKCIGCHAIASLPGKNAVHAHQQTDDCVSCHMNRTGTDNTLHGVSNTDHWIRVDANKTAIDWTSLRRPASAQPIIALSPDVDATNDGWQIRRGIAYLDYHFNHDRRRAYLDSALIYLNEGVSRFPDDPQGHFSLGEALYELGESGPALASYNRAVEIKPDYDEAYEKIGKAETAKGNLVAAIKAYRRALALKPGDPTYLEALGTALIDSDVVKEGVNLLEKALATDRWNPNTLSSLGKVYATELGAPTMALDYFKEAITLDPDFPSGHMNLGNTYALLGRYGEAAQQYELELRMAPHSADAYFNLGRVYSLTGRIKEARSAFEKALSINPSMTVVQKFLDELK